MTPEQIAALAAACERAAHMMHGEAMNLLRRAQREVLGGRMTLAESYNARALSFSDDSITLRAHARALRDGHWKRNEETT